MKLSIRVPSSVLGLLFSSFILLPSAFAEVPGIINYQGRVTVDGTNFDGTGAFKFALVNNGATKTYWSNGVNAVSLTVTKGLYSVLLGDTGIANMTYAIPTTGFTNTDVRLRVWFNDGVTGLQQLTPDQRLAAVGYALLSKELDGTGDVSGQRLNIGVGHTLSGTLATIAGGSANTASGIAAAVGGGHVNAASGDYATVGGGGDNLAAGWVATIGGGYTNTASAGAATVGGGQFNQASGDNSTVGGGAYNTIQTNAYGSTIAGGYGNIIRPDAHSSAIGGGQYNTIQTNSALSIIAGGEGNSIASGSTVNTIAGGRANQIQSNSHYNVIVAGDQNLIGSGGGFNSIGGGVGNAISNGTWSSTIAGGEGNTLLPQATYSVIPGGKYNTVGGWNSFAAGYRAKALHHGNFVWASSEDTDFASTADNQFLIRAAGGVGIGTNAPVSVLHVNGTVTATGFAGSGAGLTGLSETNITTLSGSKIVGGVVQAAQLNVGASNTLGGTLATIAGGSNNTASGDYATVGGGERNTASSIYAAVGGGYSNRATNEYATVGGGYFNTASGSAAAVGGGHVNTASGDYATVGGGFINRATNEYATVGGGYFNTASGAAAFVGGGNDNTASGRNSTVVGGSQNTASAGWAAVGGGYFNTATTNFATVGGGYFNTATNEYATVGGGDENTASGLNAFVGGGCLNIASEDSSTVGGGFHNTASGYRSTVGGGHNNTASNQFATVPGGIGNVAGGQDSFAAGSSAKALHSSAFVWSDSSGSDFTSTGNNQFIIRAAGGVGINTNNPAGYSLNVAGEIRCGVLSQSSDRNLKENFASVDARAVLAKVTELPVTQWNFKTDTRARHLGPMAQDFKAAFGLGSDETAITTLDADGVALAAIKGLYQELQDEKARNAALEKRLAELERRLDHGGK